VPDPLAGICARFATVPDPLAGICAMALNIDFYFEKSLIDYSHSVFQTQLSIMFLFECLAQLLKPCQALFLKKGLI
jgi:hypothetical protein